MYLFEPKTSGSLPQIFVDYLPLVLQIMLYVCAIIGLFTVKIRILRRLITHALTDLPRPIIHHA
ncbi:TPA_asm: P6 [Leucadendron betacytorhabdovirus 1]|nr:TPA_asm: P6 [Leucadendron betacytorhabdovirus 1]